MRLISSKSIYDSKRKETSASDALPPEENWDLPELDVPKSFREEPQPAAKPVVKPAASQPAAKPVVKPAATQPVAKPVVKPAASQPAAKPVVKSAASQPAAKPVVKPAASQPAAKPVVKSAASQPAAKPVAKPAASQPAAKPVAKPTASQPAARPTANSASQQPAARQRVARPAPTAVRPASATRKPTVAASSAAAPAQKTASQTTMAQTAQRRRAAAAKSAEEAQTAQRTAASAQPRVRAGFVEEPEQRPQRTRPAPSKKRRRKRKKKKSFAKRLGRFIVVLALLFAMYLTAVFSNIPFIAKWRTIYIQTAMATMRHQWLATYFIPHSVIDEVMADVAASRDAQIGKNTQWGDDTETKSSDKDEHRNPTLTNTKGMTQAEIDFFDTFWEVDVDSMLEYVREHPAALNDGWERIDINHSALSDTGTTIRTIQDEQVLAIDAYEGVLIIRQSGTGYRGIMAICKDPSRLSIQPASTLGSVGEVAGVIAEAHNGLIAMTASGFIDEGGVGNGGSIVGYAMCNGMSYGEHLGYGYKRLELRQDNHIYIVDADGNVHPDTTDCMEFSPAMIIDGEIVVDATSGFTDLQPRACMGQSKYGEIIMLLIEGRLPATSLGLGVPECARIMARHECWQAMNLDGGTSAMIWYKGDYIMKSSNPVLSAGRTLPNAFVYAKAK